MTKVPQGIYIYIYIHMNFENNVFLFTMVCFSKCKKLAEMSLEILNALVSLTCHCVATHHEEGKTCNMQMILRNVFTNRATDILYNPWQREHMRKL